MTNRIFHNTLVENQFQDALIGRFLRRFNTKEAVCLFCGNLLQSHNNVSVSINNLCSYKPLFAL